MTSLPRFRQARYKLKWAYDHINQAHAIWRWFLKTDFCRLGTEQYPDGMYGAWVEVTDLPPADLNLAIGDAIHNIRCALDYAINEVAGLTSKRMTFPMDELRESLVASFAPPSRRDDGRAVGAGRNYTIEMAAPGIKDLIIDTIRPYKDGNNLLWALNKLDARDKHRLLFIAYTVTTIKGICAASDDNAFAMINATAEVQGNRRLGLGRIWCPFEIKSYGEISAEIILTEPGIIESQPVFPFLINASEAVSETIDRLDEFVLSPVQ